MDVAFFDGGVCSQTTPLLTMLGSGQAPTVVSVAPSSADWQAHEANLQARIGELHDLRQRMHQVRFASSGGSVVNEMQSLARDIRAVEADIEYLHMAASCEFEQALKLAEIGLPPLFSPIAMERKGSSVVPPAGAQLKPTTSSTLPRSYSVGKGAAYVGNTPTRTKSGIQRFLEGLGLASDAPSDSKRSQETKRRIHALRAEIVGLQQKTRLTPEDQRQLQKLRFQLKQLLEAT